MSSWGRDDDGNEGPRVAIYNQDGIGWARQESSRLRKNFRKIPALPRHKGCCQYCYDLLANAFSSSALLQHQPGLAALVESAKTCFLCYVLLCTLDSSLLRFFNGSSTALDAEPSFVSKIWRNSFFRRIIPIKHQSSRPTQRRKVSDLIRIHLLNHQSYDTECQRFWVTWSCMSNPWFSFSGDLIAVARIVQENGLFFFLNQRVLLTLVTFN
jgi:hypothetical protein